MVEERAERIDQEKIKVIFLIINWNGREKIDRCLASLNKYLVNLSHKILVVDNHSEDGSCELIREKFPEVWLLINPKNLGFARAANRGMEYLREKQYAFDYLCLLNNDVEFKDNSFLQLVQFMDENEQVVACQPALLDKKGRPQSGIAGFRLSLQTAFNHFFFLSIIFPKTFKGLFINQNYYYRKKRWVELDWLSGAALVIRQAALDIIGPMPEYFFMYAEDLAYGEQLRKAGKLIYYPGARVYHWQDEKEKGNFQTQWLDSAFGLFRLKAHVHPKMIKPKEKPYIAKLLSLLILKLVFLTGFILRWLIYSLWSLAPENKEAKKKTKEMAVYIAYIIRTLLKMNQVGQFKSKSPCKMR